MRKRSINNVIAINIIFSVCIILFFIFNNGYIKSEFRKSNDNNAAFFVNEFQNNFYSEINRLKKMSIAAINDDTIATISNYARLSGDYLNSVRRLSKQCEFVSISFDYQITLAIELTRFDTVVTSSGSIYSEHFVVDSSAGKQISQDILKLSPGLHAVSNYIVYVSRVSRDASSFIIVPKQSFIDYIVKKLGGFYDNYAVFADGKVWLSSGSIPKDISFDALSENGVKIDGSQYRRVTVNSLFENTPLSFVYLYSLSEYEDAIQYVNTYTLLCAFAFLIINFLMLLRQYQINASLRRLARSLYSESSGTEIETISNVLENLQRDNKFLQTELAQNAEIYEGQLLLRLMTGEKEDLTSERCKSLSDKFEKYIVMFFMYSSELEGSQELEQMLSVQYYFERVFTDTDCKTYVIRCDNRDRFIDTLSEAVEKLELKRKVLFGLSRIFDDIGELCAAHIESRQAVYGCTAAYFLYNYVCLSDNANLRSLYSMSGESEREIINMTLNGNVEAIEKFFDGFLYEKLQYINYKSFMRLYSHLLNILQNIVNTKNISEEVAEDIDEMLMPENIHQYVRYAYVRVARLCGNTTKNMYEIIIEYIDTNIDKCISANSIAYSLKITPEYLSSYFKKNNGQNISTYINNKKMEYAKKLLDSDKNIKISEVAEKVGIDRLNTFTRKFKNYTGVTPGQYRHSGNDPEM